MRLATMFSIFVFLLSPSSFASTPTRCRDFKPFEPLAKLRTEIEIYQLSRYRPGKGNVPVKDEEQFVCASETAHSIELKDIRGRESEWFDCDKPKPENVFCCDLIYRGSKAKACVRPAMVIRKRGSTDALDTHAHVFITPRNDSSRTIDLFAQSMSDDLSQLRIILNVSTGGAGPNADQDRYYVRIRFHP